MVKLFSILNGEALSPSHPAHRYFIGRNQMFWQTIKSLDPKDIDPDSEECLASFSLITGGGGAVGSGPAASTRRPLRWNSGHRGCPPAGGQQMAAGEKSAMNMKEMKESISMGQEGKFTSPSDFI